MSEGNALISIQRELKAPKGQFNKFGNYKYRSCEDILEAVKPILCKYSATLTISDEIVPVGGWVFVKATAFLKFGSEIYAVSAFARLENEKKGMDAAQLTGCASSYARKYALNGLFLIDDTKDSDALPPQTDFQGRQSNETPKPDIRQGEDNKTASALRKRAKRMIDYADTIGVTYDMLEDAVGQAPEDFSDAEIETVKAAFMAMKEGKDFPTAYAEVVR